MHSSGFQSHFPYCVLIIENYLLVFRKEVVQCFHHWQWKIEAKQFAFALSIKSHCVSPEGRVEARGGIDEDEL